MRTFAAIALALSGASAFHQPLMATRGARKAIRMAEQEPMDLDLDQMFDVFDEADKAIPDEPKVAAAAAVTMTGIQSKALPFVLAPAGLDGTMAGDVGFDPLSFSTSGNLKWMREAELKHGRLCMLAILGYVAVDMGLRFPNFAGIDFASVDSLHAHDAMVKSGPMYAMFALVLGFEALTYPAIAEMMAGETDRQPGDFKFDPLGFGGGDKFELAEIQHCRTAMLAFAGIVTASAAFEKPFPYY